MLPVVQVRLRQDARRNFRFDVGVVHFQGVKIVCDARYLLGIVEGVRRVVGGHRAADLTARTCRVGGLHGFGLLHRLVVWPEFRRTNRCGGGFGAVAVNASRSGVRMRRRLVKA